MRVSRIGLLSANRGSFFHQEIATMDESKVCRQCATNFPAEGGIVAGKFDYCSEACRDAFEDEPCPDCGGSGTLHDEDCDACVGTGWTID
jgi:hypothetical protein